MWLTLAGCATSAVRVTGQATEYCTVCTVPGAVRYAITGGVRAGLHQYAAGHTGRTAVYSTVDLSTAHQQRSSAQCPVCSDEWNVECVENVDLNANAKKRAFGSYSKYGSQYM